MHSDADATKAERLEMLVQLGLGDPFPGSEMMRSKVIGSGDDEIRSEMMESENQGMMRSEDDGIRR